MAERKVDYFGSFLDAMKGQSGDDPLNQVLKALRSGEQPMKNLIVLTDNSLSNLITVIRKLEDLQLVERTSADTLRLTDKGREYAMVLE